MPERVGKLLQIKPQRNVVYERYVFNSCEQNPGESVDSHVARLRKFASSCEFGSLTDELIRDRLVIGLIDRGTKGKLLREKSLTFDKAIDIARSNEITSKQLESMKSNTNDPPTKEEVNLVGKRKGKDSKKYLSGKPKQGKNVPSKKKTTGNARKPLGEVHLRVTHGGQSQVLKFQVSPFCLPRPVRSWDFSS